MSVRRFDRDVLGVAFAFTRIDGDASSTGPLVVRAAISRTGIQRYASGNEYRDVRDVFAPESLASFDGAPVTIGHPPDMVTMATRGLAVGFVRGVKRDGNVVGAELVLYDDRAISGVLDGSLVELSAGYTCDLAPAGVYDGQWCVGAQKNIRANHVALGGPGWGRCGAACSVKG